MYDIEKENKKYFSSVMQSIEALHKTEEEIENEKILCEKFIDFLVKNADEIGRFHAVEKEIADFLQNFSFSGKIDFTLVRDKLLPLSILRQKLIEMGNEAKKLANLPDRYNCYKAMEVCKQLTMFCLNEMKSTDYDKVLATLDKNIPTLIFIQKEFDKEKQILEKIKNLIQQHSAVLNKFSACKTELQQFVASFPNNRDTDFNTVENRINTLNGLNTQITNIETTLNLIKNYSDRYNKNVILHQTENLISFAYSQMNYNDINKIILDLKNTAANLKSLLTAFDKEKNDTIAFKNKLTQNLPNSWKDDNENLVLEIASIITKGTETSNFYLHTFLDKEQNNIQRKTTDISNSKQQYPSICKKYDKELQKNIIDKYIISDELQKWLQKYKNVQRKKKKKMILFICIAAVVTFIFITAAIVLIIL